MDDQDRQSAPPSAEAERAKGADLEYDAEDEDALGTSAPAPEHGKTPHIEEN